MGVGALARVGNVHPLRKEATVQRDMPIVVSRQLVQAAAEGGRESPVRRHRGRRKALDASDDLCRRGIWLAQLRLKLAEEGLAFIEAANRVVARPGDAV